MTGSVSGICAGMGLKLVQDEMSLQLERRSVFWGRQWRCAKREPEHRSDHGTCWEAAAPAQDLYVGELHGELWGKLLSQPGI